MGIPSLLGCHQGDRLETEISPYLNFKFKLGAVVVVIIRLLYL
jgi:hypothetical protein